MSPSIEQIILAVIALLGAGGGGTAIVLKWMERRKDSAAAAKTTAEAAQVEAQAKAQANRAEVDGAQIVIAMMQKVMEASQTLVAPLQTQVHELLEKYGRLAKEHEHCEARNNKLEEELKAEREVSAQMREALRRIQERVLQLEQTKGAT